jgi:serine/threonine protein kinase
VKSQQLDEEAIFHIARDLSDVAKRETYLDQVCATDQALRERVEALLAVHDQEQSFLKSSSPVAATIDQSPVTEQPGQEIGRYKLLQKIGEGGFGVVYMAEQQRPVRRKVALKIIKPGMDTHAVIARFEAERQALALMDHPNIARVLDGGATQSGRPYFVMELVKGVPITEYCDKNQLSTEERLNLFNSVCQAVQHAHQKGIIHRDIKPSNVLITLADGEPVVKVIDFGIAKATNQQLTERTLFTAFGQMIGTPQYMSPEQAEMSCLDVDTRSDVYSLGVLLYELLTGTTPLEGDRLRTAGFAEMQRLIREEEPPKPSTRLSTSGDSLTIIAKHRSVSPEKLKHQIRGDLDWIVMKSLEKDRNRRYRSAEALADDVRCYRENRIVSARKPSVGYRVQKWTARNRTAFVFGSLISFLLVALLVEKILSWTHAVALLSQNHELVVRDAMLKSFEGDIDEVDRILADYKGLFNSADQWPIILRASAHLHRGDYQKVRDQLVPIVDSEECDPSIPAIAILATADFHHGDWNRPISLANRLRNAKPRNEYHDIDLLFLGYGMVWVDTAKSVSIIEDVLSRNPNWLICHAILADALIHEGNIAGNRAMTEAAFKKSNALRELMPDNPFTMNVALFSHNCLIEWRRRAGLPYEDLTESGAAIAERFQESFPNYALDHQMTAQFYETVGGDEEKLDRAWVRTLENGGETCQWTAIGALYKRRTSTDMIELIDSLPPETPRSGWLQVARAYILSDIPNRRAEALEVFESFTTQDSTITDRYMAIQIPLLLGETDRARERANEWLSKWAEDPLVKSTANVFPEEQLLRIIATEGATIPELDNELTLSLSNYLLALLAVSKGERAEAKNCFKQAIVKPHGWTDIYWAEAFLHHLSMNRNWPVDNAEMRAD